MTDHGVIISGKCCCADYTMLRIWDSETYQPIGWIWSDPMGYCTDFFFTTIAWGISLEKIGFCVYPFQDLQNMYFPNMELVNLVQTNSIYIPVTPSYHMLPLDIKLFETIRICIYIQHITALLWAVHKKTCAGAASQLTHPSCSVSNHELVIRTQPASRAHNNCEPTQCVLPIVWTRFAS